MHNKISSKFNKISFSIIISLCVLIPLIFLPSNIAALSAVKGVTLYIGVFLALSFWLIHQFIEGTLKIPKSSFFLALLSWVILSLISALTSSNVSVSLWGRSFIFDSFATNLVLSLFVFMVATFSRDHKKLIKIFLATFIGSSITILLQTVLFLSKSVPFVGSFLANISTQGTLVGSWVDFSYFATFVFLLSLLMYEVLLPKGFFKITSFITMILSLLALVFLNFKTAWLITIISSLLIFVYKSSVERSIKNPLSKIIDGNNGVENENKSHKFPLMSLIVLILSLFFFLGSSSIGSSLSKMAGVSFTEVKPSFTVSNTIMRSALYHDPLLGDGAGSYSTAWNLYHPANINNSLFWNVSFEKGFNLFESIITTNGILPALAFIIVIILALIQGFKLFSYNFPDRFTRFIAVTSFVMTLATFVLFVFGSPSLVLIIFGFTYIGLLFGVSSLVGKTKVISLDYLKDPRTSFFSILILVLMSMLCFSAVYFTGVRFASVVMYNKSLSSGDINKSKNYIDKAISLANIDTYWKTRTVLYSTEFTNLLSTEKPDKDQLQKVFTTAEQSAQNVILLNKKDAYAWLNLSQVYQLVDIGNNDDVLTNAKQAGLEAEKYNPNNPLFKLNNANIKLIEKDKTGALADIDLALQLKPNYLDAFILIGQIKKSEGNNNALVDKLNEYISSYPANDQAYISLGNEYMQLGSYSLAVNAFAKAVNLDTSNANNLLLYIRALETSGDKKGVIRELNNLKNRFPNIKGVDEQIDRVSKSLEPQ